MLFTQRAEKMNNFPYSAVKPLFSFPYPSFFMAIYSIFKNFS